MNEPTAPERRSEKEIFFEAIEKATPNERAAYLDGACGGDELVRRRVEALLAKHFQQDNFMKEPAVEAGTVAAPAASYSEAAGMVIDRYKLREKIGEGGCGIVFVADQEEPIRRRVALKLIKPGMDTKSVLARFEAERQALAMMDHPNIAKVLDAGATEAGRPYFVMELVRGIKITDYCDQHKLTAQQRLELFIEVCQGVQHAHQKAIIHRDLKPSNILVTLNDGAAVPKIIDFGIAKAIEGRLTDLTIYTELHQLIGTPAYMSPEQALMTSVDIDTRSDIYSLGVLLYELLVGRTPFDPQELTQAGLDEMRRTIREKEPLRPSTRLSTLAQADLDTAAIARGTEAPRLRSLLRGDLDWIVMQCLEKDRNRRYETANGLASDVRRFLSNEPVVARPPSAAYRFQKWVRRNKLAFAAAGAIATVLVVGVVVSTSQAVRATRAERRAQDEAVHARQAEKVAEEKSTVAEEQRQRATAQERDSRLKAYASDMNLVQRQLEMNNLDSALRLLNRHRPGPALAGPPSELARTNRLTAGLQTDLRGWEWRYLWNQCQSEAQAVLWKGSNPISTLTVSHDGKWLAVGLGGQSVLVLDLVTRQEITRLPSARDKVRAAFSPRESLLAYSNTGLGPTNRQNSILLWNAATRQIVTNLSIGGVCLDLAFTDDGQTLVTATRSSDNQVTLWRVADGTRLAQYAVPVVVSPGVVSFDAPFAIGGDLSVGAHDENMHVMDLATGQERWKKKAANEFVTSLALAPDGKMLASGEGLAESAIHLWDVASGVEMGRLEGHRAGVNRLVFWRDGKTLASASIDQTIRLWDVTDPGKGRSLGTLRGHKASVTALALLADNTTLVSGSADGSVCLWNVGAARRERKPVILPAQVEEWRFAPDSKSVVTVDIRGRVARWQGTDFQEMQPLLEIGSFDVACLAEDSRWLADAWVGRGIRVWDLHRRTYVGQFTPPAGKDPSTGAEYTHSRTRVGGWTTDPGPVILCRFLAHGSKLMIAHRNDGSLHEWDLNTWQETRHWPCGSGIRSHAFSQDELWCLNSAIHPNSGSSSSLIDLTTGQQTSLDVGWYDWPAFSPDGKFFAGASWGGYARLWETVSRREVATFRGFLNHLWTVAFSPDGKRLATGSQGKEAIKLWDVESHQELLTLEGQGSTFNRMAFSPDDAILGCNTGRGLLHLWRAPTWAEIEAAEQAQANEK